jgi:hypothetical protein
VLSSRTELGPTVHLRGSQSRSKARDLPVALERQVFAIDQQRRPWQNDQPGQVIGSHEAR